VTLRETAVQGVAWSAVQQLGRQGIRFVISVVLARMLLPQHYGVIGILLVFIAISQTLIDSGFGQVLIQKKDATHLDECSVFYTNIAVSVILYLGLCAAAPWIAHFYDMPQLAMLTRVLSFRIVIVSFGLIHSTLLTKRIDFKTQAQITLVSSVVSGVAGIVMAYRGYGIWSLVVQSLSGAVLNTLCLWLLCDWRPSLRYSFIAIRSMFVFGSRILVSGLLDTVFRNIYIMVIGKVFPAAELGHYTRGDSLARLPVQNLAVIFRRVTFSVFASVHDDRPRLVRGIRKALCMLFFLTCPIMLGLTAVADNLVEALLTPKWEPCVPYVRLLCIGGVLYPLHAINGNALLAVGRSDLRLRVEVIKKALTALAVIVTWRWGIQAMIIGQIIQSALAYVVNGYYTGKLVGYSYARQTRDVLPYLLCALVMGAAAYALDKAPIPTKAARLTCQAILGALTYFGLCALFRLDAFVEAWAIGKRFVRRNKAAPLKQVTVKERGTEENDHSATGT